MSRGLQEYRQTMLGWTALIGGTAAFFIVTRRTQYHQLAIGLLVSAIVIPAALLLVEAVWRAAGWLAECIAGDRKS